MGEIPHALFIHRKFCEDNKYITHKHLQTPLNYHEDKKQSNEEQVTMLKKIKKNKIDRMGREGRKILKKKFSGNAQKEKEIEKKFSKKIIRKGSLGRDGGRCGGWGCIKKLSAKAAKITAFYVDADKHTQTTRKRAKRPKKRPKIQFYLSV